MLNTITSHLKIIFWPNICVGAKFQILEILEYVCGLKLDSVLILTQNLYFEMTCDGIGSWMVFRTISKIHLTSDGCVICRFKMLTYFVYAVLFHLQMPYPRTRSIFLKWF